MRKSNSSCIYKITNLVNNKFYIGSTIHYNIRINIHFSSLRRNKHHCSYLQNAWNKYGESNFKSEILEICTPDNLIKTEQAYLDKLNPEYNILKVVRRRKDEYSNNRKGKLSNKVLESFREKMKSYRGRKCSVCGEYNKKIIIEEDNEGNTKEWNSVSEAVRFYKDPNIWKVLSGKRKKAAKRKWKYKKE